MYNIGDHVEIASIDSKPGKQFYRRAGIIDSTRIDEYRSYHIQFEDELLNQQAQTVWWFEHNIRRAEEPDKPVDFNSRQVSNALFPNIPQSLVVLVLFFLLQIAVVFVLNIIFLAAGMYLSVSAKMSIYFILIALAYVPLITWCNRKNGNSLRCIFKSPTIGKGFVAASILLLIGWWCVLFPILDLLLNTSTIVSQSNSKLAQSLTVMGGSWFGFFYAILLGPILEETLYRGIILKGLLKNCSQNKAIVISALLFGIMHFNLVQSSYAFILGMVLALLYVKSGSLKLCILIHILNNSFSFIIGQHVNSSTIYYVLPFGLIVFVSLTMYFYRKPDRFHLV